MKFVYQAWLLFLTVIGSSLISSLLLAGGGFALLMFVIIFYTLLFGVPCSLIIRIVIRRKDRRGYFLQGALHVIAGFLIGLFMNVKMLGHGDWVNLANLIRSGLPILFAAHAGVYYLVYFLMRRFLQMDDPMWEEENSTLEEAMER